MKDKMDQCKVNVTMRLHLHYDAAAADDDDDNMMAMNNNNWTYFCTNSFIPSITRCSQLI
jgi:uncharacterized heparinase superfamily protein